MARKLIELQRGKKMKNYGNKKQFYEYSNRHHRRVRKEMKEDYGFSLSFLNDQQLEVYNIGMHKLETIDLVGEEFGRQSDEEDVEDDKSFIQRKNSVFQIKHTMNWL